MIVLPRHASREDDRWRPFTKLFGSLLVFVYHCFDRIVVQGYLPLLTRPEHIVHFFRDVHGVHPITKEALAQRTAEYQQWVEAYRPQPPHPHRVAGRGGPEDQEVKKEDYVRPYGARMERAHRFGVYFIFKSLEQGPKFGVRVPKYPTGDPDYRIISRQRSRYTHYYFYIRDEVLGPFLMCVGSFLPFQTTYYLNGHHVIARELHRQGVPFRTDDNAFLSTANLDALQAVADGLDPGRDSRAPRLLDPGPRAEVLEDGAGRDQSAAPLLAQPSRVLPQLRLPAVVPDPQDLRALV